LIKPNDRTFVEKQLRVIGSEGDQVGIISYEEARNLAVKAELDLVLVAENAEPNVCRIMDFGKLVYGHKKKIKEQKRHQHTQKLKEIKFRLRIDSHDYKYKVNHAVEFLEKGFKVKTTLMFKGRELAHKELGFDMMNKLVEDLSEHGAPDDKLKFIGRNITATFSPLKGHVHHH